MVLDRSGCRKTRAMAKALTMAPKTSEPNTSHGRGTDGCPVCGDGFSALPETGEGKAAPAPEEVGLRSSSSSKRSASSRVLSMLWSSGWAMAQIRMPPVKTGLVALIPNSSIVRPECVVRRVRVERLYLEALSIGDVQGQHDRQTEQKGYENILDSQSSHQMRASEKPASPFRAETKKSLVPLTQGAAREGNKPSSLAEHSP